MFVDNYQICITFLISVPKVGKSDREVENFLNAINFHVRIFVQEFDRYTVIWIVKGI